MEAGVARFRVTAETARTSNVSGDVTWTTSQGETQRKVKRKAGNSLKPTVGFEPTTPALRERCSGQLSYVGSDEPV